MRISGADSASGKRIRCNRHLGGERRRKEQARDENAKQPRRSTSPCIAGKFTKKLLESLFNQSKAIPGSRRRPLSRLAADFGAATLPPPTANKIEQRSHSNSSSGFIRASVCRFPLGRDDQNARLPRSEIEYGHKRVGRFVQSEDRGSIHAIDSARPAIACHNGMDRPLEIHDTNGSGC